MSAQVDGVKHVASLRVRRKYFEKFSISLSQVDVSDFKSSWDVIATTAHFSPSNWYLSHSDLNVIRSNESFSLSVQTINTFSCPTQYWISTFEWHIALLIANNVISFPHTVLQFHVAINHKSRAIGEYRWNERESGWWPNELQINPSQQWNQAHTGRRDELMWKCWREKTSEVWRMMIITFSCHIWRLWEREKMTE